MIITNPSKPSVSIKPSMFAKPANPLFSIRVTSDLRHSRNMD